MRHAIKSHIRYDIPPPIRRAPTIKLALHNHMISFRVISQIQMPRKKSGNHSASVCAMIYALRPYAKPAHAKIPAL